MAIKMAVYYKNIRKFSLRPTNSKDLHVKCWFSWFLSSRHHPCNIPVMQLMHHSEFDIFKMASRMVADKFYKPVGVATNLLTCLVDL